MNILPLAAMQRCHQKIHPCVTITVYTTFQMSSYEDKALCKGTMAVVFPNGMHWPKRHFPVEETTYSFPFPPSLLPAPQSCHLPCGRSGCLWTQLINSEKNLIFFPWLSKITGNWTDRLQTLRRVWGNWRWCTGENGRMQLSVGKGHKTQVAISKALASH